MPYSTFTFDPQVNSTFFGMPTPSARPRSPPTHMFDFDPRPFMGGRAAPPSPPSHHAHGHGHGYGAHHEPRGHGTRHHAHQEEDGRRRFGFPPPHAHGHGHGHPGHHTPPSDLEAEERILLAQLDAVRQRKAFQAQQAVAQAEQAAREQAKRREFIAQQVRMQQEVQQQRQQQAYRQIEQHRQAQAQVQQQRQIQQQQQQQQQASSQAQQLQALMNALTLGRSEAAQIERTREREVQARMVAAQRAHALRAQLEKEQRAQVEREREMMREKERALRQRQEESQFWERLENVCPGFSAAQRGGLSARPQVVQPTLPVKQETPQPKEQEQEKEAQFPIDILKMIFGPDVVISHPATPRSDTPKPTTTTLAEKTAATPTPTTESKGKEREHSIPTPAPVPAQTQPKAEKQMSAEEQGQKFIDDLFGAFYRGFAGVGDEVDVEEKPKAEKKVEQKQEKKEEEPVVEEPTVQESATQSTSTPAEPTDDNIPSSAADLEAEKAQATADLIQAKYRQHLLRVTRLEKLENLENKLTKLDEGWSFPQTLDFVKNERERVNGALLDPVDSASSQSESLVVPPLAFTPHNVPYHAHAQGLLGLLVEADSVSSDGDEQVRTARREFVRRVEGKLGEMEVGRREVWEKMKASEEERPAQEVEAVEAETVSEDKEERPVPATENTSAPTESALIQPTEIPSTSESKEPITLPEPIVNPTSPLPTSEAQLAETSSVPDTTVAAEEKEETVKEDTETEESTRSFSDTEDELDEEKGKKELVEEFVVL